MVMEKIFAKLIKKHPITHRLDDLKREIELLRKELIEEIITTEIVLKKQQDMLENLYSF